MNYYKKMKTVFLILPLMALLVISCKVSDSDNDPSGNPVNAGIVAIGTLEEDIFGNACQIESLILQTEAVPDGTPVQFGENSSSACLIGPSVNIQSDGSATVGLVADYVTGIGETELIPVTISLLLANGTTLDQSTFIVVNGIGFSPPPDSEEGIDVQAAGCRCNGSSSCHPNYFWSRGS